jgi:hypothetical protein
MNCFLNYAFLFLVPAVIAVDAVADEKKLVKINVTAAPALPVQNLLAENSGFENGLKGWTLNKKAIKNKSFTPSEINGKKVVSINSSNGVIGRTVNLKKPFKPGEKYILSCLIKADNKVSQRAGLFSGCGATVSFFSKDWKKAVTVFARSADTKGKWIKAVSKPIECPEWAHLYRLHMGISYSPGSGYIDDVVFAKAYTMLQIKVEASVNIRQVIVDNELGKTVFDSDLLDDGQKTYTKTIKVLSPYQYQIKVLDESGNVYTKNYPDAKK